MGCSVFRVGKVLGQSYHDFRDEYRADRNFLQRPRPPHALAEFPRRGGGALSFRAAGGGVLRPTGVVVNQSRWGGSYNLVRPALGNRLLPQLPLAAAPCACARRATTRHTPRRGGAGRAVGRRLHATLQTWRAA